ncbi:hypothetical protein PLICRDRAFT_99663 [Plicaturopsis crispa FD-325 SS-3]|nr:hypothetical protein PLICRDRAFT_99663 [Plicaturopsis crispa FD-325 SS-3]
MASSASSKKQRSKPPRGRPAATSLLSQPVVQDASSLSHLSSFSPNGTLFAFLSLAVDKHRLRVFDTVSGQTVAEYVVASARVSALTWSRFNPQSSAAEGDSASQPAKKKKRRKSQGETVGPEVVDSTIEVVVLGLTDGSLEFFSPTRARVVRRLSHVSSTSAILSLAIPDDGQGAHTVWTSGADGTIRLWDAWKNDIRSDWKSDDRIPYSSMAIRPRASSEDEDRVDILVANHAIRLLSTTSGLDDFDVHKPEELASFTGHASSITHIQWDVSQKPPTRFLTMAEADRVVQIWEVPDTQAGSSSQGKVVASIPLDSDARHMSLSNADHQTLLVLSATGKISVYPVPAEFPPDKKKHRLPTLLSRCNVAITSKKNPAPVHVVNASFSSEEGRIRVARLVGGVRPVFDVVRYLDDAGEFVPEINIVKDDSDVTLASEATASNAAPNKRYAESSSLAVGSGVELGQEETMDDLAPRDIDGVLDVDLAELSLGQRLTALQGPDARGTTSDSDEGTNPSKKRAKKGQDAPAVVPANSLTRTLIQALHSSDVRLLETCLAHSDVTLIRNTVRRLPPQLAVPLITACVERLGRGARAANMKGGGGGASSQRGTGLIAWVKAVLAVHSGHLMTMPDLVARLAGLHATLTSRLTLQDSLLSLNGRLDMVLSQIEMRSSAAPAPLSLPKTKKPSDAPGKRQAKRYVEGESEDEEQMDVEVEMGSDADEGSIEDVELGGDSQDEEDDDEDASGSESDEDDSDDEGPTLNGFIDDEAEEDFDDDEEDESE